MKKILITGGAGFIGSQLADFYLKKNLDVTILDSLQWGKKGFFQHNFSNKNFHFIKVNLLNTKKLNQIFPKNIDTVFHLAANSDIKRGAQDTSVDFKNTIQVSYNILEAMRKNNCKRIFYTSGSGVYGDVGNLFTKETTGPLLPVSMYGATKLSAEAMISAYVNLFGFQAWILRPANIIGPRATHGVIFDFLNKLKKNSRSLEILGNGKQSKSYLYIDDVLQAFDLVWRKTKEKINLFNLASNSFVTVTEIAKIILRAKNFSNTQLVYTGGKVGWTGDVPVVRIDSQKIKRLGWRCQFSSHQAVEKTVKILLNTKK